LGFPAQDAGDGRRQILNILLPGDLMGLQASLLDASDHGIEAIADVEVCVFSRRKTWSLFAQSTTQTAPAPMTSTMPGTDLFYRETWAPTHWRSSESIGEAVYNRAGERIGEIDDLPIDKSGRVLAAVVGVGGFLGMDEHKVAISYSSFEMTREANGKPRLVVDINKAVLKDAPAYKPVDAPKRS
jgi:PRC-barrel domain